MSVLESLARSRPLRLPRADGLTPWIVPLVIVAIWQAACATGFGATACVVVTTLGFGAALVDGAAVDGVAVVAGATGDGVLRSIVAG